MKMTKYKGLVTVYTYFQGSCPRNPMIYVREFKTSFKVMVQLIGCCVSKHV